MRRVWYTFGILGALLGHVGCKHEAILRPPKNPEEYRLPPDDPRYREPPQPPKEYLNQDPLNKKSADPGAPSTPGGMGRTGRPGGS